MCTRFKNTRIKREHLLDTWEEPHWDYEGEKTQPGSGTNSGRRDHWKSQGIKGIRPKKPCISSISRELKESKYNNSFKTQLAFN